MPAMTIDCSSFNDSLSRFTEKFQNFCGDLIYNFKNVCLEMF